MRKVVKTLILEEVKDALKTIRTLVVEITPYQNINTGAFVDMWISKI